MNCEEILRTRNLYNSFVLILLQLSGCPIWVDPEATKDKYQALDTGDANLCTCKNCRNYRTQRSQFLPKDFISFAQAAGIDPLKEQRCSGGFLHDGRYCYSAEYEFIGRFEGPVKSAADYAPKWKRWLHLVPLTDTGIRQVPVVHLTDAFSYSLSQYRVPLDLKSPQAGLCFLNINVALPWVINEPPDS